MGYKGPAYNHIVKNLSSADLAPDVITKKLSKDLAYGRVLKVQGIPVPFISLPLGLIPKHDSGFRRIHHLSHPKGESVNYYILEHYSNIKYTSLKQIYALVVKGRRGCTIVKKDIKDTFRNILLSPAIY